MENMATPAKYSGKAIVAFLDLLGFSEKIRNHWNDKDTLQCVLGLKKKTNNKPVGIQQVYNPARVSEIYECRVQAISDHFIVSCALNNEEDVHATFWSFVSLIENCQKICVEAIKNGYVLRGGMEYGSIYWDNADIIGPALIDAYNLENGVARTARIILGSKLNSMLQNLLNKSIKPNPPNVILQPLLRDVDGYIILDPLELLAFGNSVYVEDIEALRDKAEKPEQKYKYTGMITYMKRNLSTKKVLGIEDLGGY